MALSSYGPAFFFSVPGLPLQLPGNNRGRYSRSVGCALGTIFLLLRRVMHHAPIEHAAADTPVFGAELVVQFSGQRHAGVHLGIAGHGTAKEEAQGHNAAHHRTAGTAGLTHAGAEARGQRHKSPPLFLAAHIHNAAQHRFTTEKAALAVVFFRLFAHELSKILCNFHLLPP